MIAFEIALLIALLTMILITFHYLLIYLFQNLLLLAFAHLEFRKRLVEHHEFQFELALEAEVQLLVVLVPSFTSYCFGEVHVRPTSC